MTKNYRDYRLRTYSANGAQVGSGSDVNLTGRGVLYNSAALSMSRLACDDQGNIFFNDMYRRTIHVLLANGQSHLRILPSEVITSYPNTL